MVLSRKRLQASFQRVEEEQDLDAPKRRRPLWERGLLFLLLAIVTYVTVYFIFQERHHYREIALRQQLWQIRNALIVYYTKHEVMPPDLRTLAMTQVVDPRSGVFFPLLENVHIDDKGQVVDPLGYPYVYDALAGKVVSAAPCCQNW